MVYKHLYSFTNNKKGSYKSAHAFVLLITKKKDLQDYSYKLKTDNY